MIDLSKVAIQANMANDIDDLYIYIDEIINEPLNSPSSTSMILSIFNTNKLSFLGLTLSDMVEIIKYKAENNLLTPKDIDLITDNNKFDLTFILAVQQTIKASILNPITSNALYLKNIYDDIGDIDIEYRYNDTLISGSVKLEDVLLGNKYLDIVNSSNIYTINTKDVVNGKGDVKLYYKGVEAQSNYKDIIEKTILYDEQIMYVESNISKNYNLDKSYMHMTDKNNHNLQKVIIKKTDKALSGDTVTLTNNEIKEIYNYFKIHENGTDVSAFNNDLEIIEHLINLKKDIGNKIGLCIYNITGANHIINKDKVWILPEFTFTIR